MFPHEIYSRLFAAAPACPCCGLWHPQDLILPVLKCPIFTILILPQSQRHRYLLRGRRSTTSSISTRFISSALSLSECPGSPCAPGQSIDWQPSAEPFRRIHHPATDGSNC